MKNFILITFLAFTALCYSQSNKAATKTFITEKKIIVTSGKVSSAEFETLINETLTKYKDRPGIQIIVKASGHKTFNHKTPAELKPEPIAFRIISSDKKLKSGNAVELQPETIRFTKETEAIDIKTQDSIKTKTIDIHQKKLR